jgi:hypothetical protein
MGGIIRSHIKKANDRSFMLLYCKKSLKGIWLCPPMGARKKNKAKS